MLALRERRTWLRLPIMNTHEGTEGTEGLFFWQKLDFLRVKISWISRNTRRLWHMMNAMTIPMKMIAWWSSLCLRSWFSISGLILKDISNFVHKIVRKKVKQMFPLLRSKRDMMIQNGQHVFESKDFLNQRTQLDEIFFPFLLSFILYYFIHKRRVENIKRTLL